MIVVDVAKIISLSYDNDIKFEYDVQKSASNREKHGIDFEEAKALWFTPHVVLMAKSIIEARFITVGKIRNKFYSCFYTVRNKDVIRLISARRSRKSEEKDYHEYYKTPEKT